MTEFIIRLTDEQEDLIRSSSVSWLKTHADEAVYLRDDVLNQLKAGIALYDQLVAEAKAASDE